MHLATKIPVFIISLLIGFYFLLRTMGMVRLFGKNQSAEEVRPGGSYDMWKIIGVIIIILGFLFLVGSLDWLIYPGK